MKHFKIYGVFRSGTNLLRLLVTENMSATCTYSLGGQKHLPVPSNWNENGYVPQPLDALVAVKDPFATLHSLFKYANTVRFRHFQCGKSWEEFLSSRFVIHMKSDPTIPAYRFANPVDYWNSFYYNMLSLETSRSLLIKYEDMLLDSTRTLKTIENKFPESFMKVDSVTLPQRDVKKMGRDIPDEPYESSEFDRTDWYTKRQYLDEFTPDQTEFVSSWLDKDVTSRLGYDDRS